MTEFVARRPLVGILGLGLPVAWRARTWAEPESLATPLRPRRRGDEGHGRHLADRSLGPGARVSIDHDFRPRLPGFAWFVDRAFTRPIAGRTLATFKALAEALAEPPGGGSPNGTGSAPSGRKALAR